MAPLGVLKTLANPSFNSAEVSFIDPLTHFMTGGCLARAGFNRTTRYATLVMVLAAEMPDLDTLWSLRGPIASFQHHRGWTHTFLGLPIDAATVLGAVWLYHRLRPKHSSRERIQLPIRWSRLFLLALTALLSHLLLDWTNSYGLRPFFPFNPRWYAGSFVFIVEPVMLLLLSFGLLAPLLSGLIGSEIGAQKQPYPARGWAVFALLGILLLYGIRAYGRLHAEDLALSSGLTTAPVLRATACPYPIDPFRWHVILDTADFYQTGTVNLLTSQVTTSSQTDVFFKAPKTPAVRSAERSKLGRIYLDWSAFPLISESTLRTNTEGGSDPGPATQVLFRDLRFAYDTLGLEGREHSPLSGKVLLSPSNNVVSLSFDGHPEK